MNTEKAPMSNHDEDVCSGGVTMCHECYAASSDSCELSDEE